MVGHLLRDHGATHLAESVCLAPASVSAMAKAGVEIACHHYRWIDYEDMPEAQEREHLRKAIAAIEVATSSRPHRIFLLVSEWPSLGCGGGVKMICDSRDQVFPVRDFVGYARNPPHPRWPGGARVAVNFAIAYEEGGEHALSNGDDHGETHLVDYVSLNPAPLGQRLLAAESLYEYGTRVGIWRIMELLVQRRFTATVFAVGQAVERNPMPVQAMAEVGFEIACHHYRWLDYREMPEEKERDHLRKAVIAIEQAIGQRPVGFFHWCGPNTRRLVVEDGGFLYDSEAYNDELPYWTQVSGKPHLVIPYAIDSNDWRYSILPGWATGEDFFNYNKATFDQLYTEGERTPKMMTVGLHARLSGRPGRARALARFLDYLLLHKDVWICTRRQIAEHWCQTHPAEQVS
jgi:peptidoglycan/xylan/chitin deacetylase (PgdA/CDA1 family)